MSFIFCFCCAALFSQTINGKAQSTLLAKLTVNDSLTYYQCRVVNAKVMVNTGAQHIESDEQQITVTEKFVIRLSENGYRLRYYTSGLTAFPNRKFSGLKIRERAYWNFNFRNERVLNSKEVEFLSALQNTGKETTEYDFAITKHTTNQIIIKQKKNFEQLLLKDSLSISKALKL